MVWGVGRQEAISPTPGSAEQAVTQSFWVSMWNKAVRAQCYQGRSSGAAGCWGMDPVWGQLVAGAGASLALSVRCFLGRAMCVGWWS